MAQVAGEISRRVEETARGTMAVSANLGRAQCRGRRKALDETSESAAGTRSSADALSGLASRQKHLVEQFVV